MKKLSGIVVVLLVLALALGYLFRDPLRDFADAQLTRDMFVAADNDTFDPGPALGSYFPGLHANYQGETITLLAPVAGVNGTVLVVNRSLATCPYSRRQVLQLQAHKPGFDAAGIGMAVLTRDDPDAQRAFAADHQVSIPALSDINALSVKTLGLLDMNIEPGDSRYGNPYPGMLVIDRDGIVVGKLFLEDYRSRVDSTAALAFARTALGIEP